MKKHKKLIDKKENMKKRKAGQDNESKKTKEGKIMKTIMKKEKNQPKDMDKWNQIKGKKMKNICSNKESKKKQPVKSNNMGKEKNPDTVTTKNKRTEDNGIGTKMIISKKQGEETTEMKAVKKLKRKNLDTVDTKSKQTKMKQLVQKKNSNNEVKKVLKKINPIEGVQQNKKMIVDKKLKSRNLDTVNYRHTKEKGNKMLKKEKKVTKLINKKKNIKNSKEELEHFSTVKYKKKNKEKKKNKFVEDKMDTTTDQFPDSLDAKENPSFSKKFISFLSEYNEEEKKEKKGKQKKREEETEDYEYFPLKDNIYNIKDEKKKKIKIDDLLYHPKDTLHTDLSRDIKYLKNEKVSSYDNSLSLLQQQKINASLAYIENIKTLNKHNVDIDRIRKAYQVQFGNTFEPKQPHSQKIKKSTLDQFKQREKQKKENDEKVEKTSENENYDKKKFTDELKENIKMSNVFEDVNEMLKSNRQKKREEYRKIAHIKRLLHEEQLKNKYKKKIKSKGYRHYMRLKDKKIKEKLLKKLGEERPEVLEQFQKYEEEYATKRMLNKDTKLKKQLKLRRRYKNEEIRKEVLKKMQEEKEEKIMLKRIIEKAAMKEDFHYSDMLQNEKKELTEKVLDNHSSSSDSDSNREEKEEEEEEEGVMDQQKVLRKELEKRNLLKYSFIQKAEAMKEVEEKNKRRIFSRHMERDNEITSENEESLRENDELEEERSTNSNQIKQKKELPNITDEELKKARKKLLADPTFVNLVNSNRILNVHDVLEEQNESNPQEKIEEISEEKKNTLQIIMEEGVNENIDLNEKEIEERNVNVETIDGEIKDICEINNMDADEVHKKSFEQKQLYNFENKIYENYINVMDNANQEDTEPVELSDSEEAKIKKSKIKINEWINYETLLEQEKQRALAEKEILEKKKNIPLHTITFNEKKDKQFDKYYIEKVPYPYNENEYEKSLNININKEVNTTKEFKSLIAPHISNKIGNIIAPLNRNLHKLANLIMPKKNKPKAAL